MGFDNLNKVIKYLSSNPNSYVDSISKDCGLNKDTTKRIISGLREDDLVIKNNDSYSLSPIFCRVCENRNNITYFGVDLLDKDISNFYYLFSKINNVWFEATGKNPTKTQIYKIISSINNKLDLGLPLVWYKYGQIPPVIFDTNTDYIKFTKEVDDKIVYNDIKIRDLILENINFNSYELERIQHKQNKLYDIKDQILDHIYKDDLDFVIDNLDEFLDLTIYDSTLSTYKDDFYSFIYNYYKLDKKIRTKTEYKDIFVQVFNTIWDMIAICNFKNDIKDYYIKNNLNLENLDYYFVSELVSAKEKFNELTNVFYDCFTITDFFNDSKTQDLINKKN